MKLYKLKITALPLSVFALILFFANFANAEDAKEPKPVKIAIIGDTEKHLADLDMLTVKLSSDDNIHVLERSDWDYLLRERSITASKIGQSSVEIGRLLGADALIILTEGELKKSGQKKEKKYLFAKLVAVKSGVILDSIVIPLDASKETFSLNDSIEYRFKPKLAKLNSNTDKVVISILNLRSEIASPELLPVEHNLNALLAHRLMREQNVLVSERWNMAEADLENTLSGNAESHYTTGSVMLEGIISTLDKKSIQVNLIIRTPDGKKQNITVDGEISKLPEVAEKLAAKCLEFTKIAKNTASWSQEKEANEYLREAIWSSSAGLYLKAAQSAESAWALGNRSKELAYLRINSYAKAAYTPTQRSKQYINISDSDKHLDAAIMALDLYKHYIIKGRTRPENKFMRDPVDFYTLGMTVLYNTVSLLKNYYEQGLITKDIDKQHATMKLIQECNEFLLKGEEQSSYACYSFSWLTMVYGKYFIENENDLIAMYKRILGHRCIRWAPQKHYLREEEDFYYSQSSTPFFIDRSEKYDKDVTLQFLDKMKREFAASDNLQLQLDSLMLKYYYGEFIDSQKMREFRFQKDPTALSKIYAFYDNHKEAFWDHSVFPVHDIKFPYHYYLENLQHRSLRNLRVHSKDLNVICRYLSDEQKKELSAEVVKRFSIPELNMCSSPLIKMLIPEEKIIEINPDKIIKAGCGGNTFSSSSSYYTIKDEIIYIPYFKHVTSPRKLNGKSESNIDISVVAVDIKTQTSNTINFPTLKIENSRLFLNDSPYIYDDTLIMQDNSGNIYLLDLIKKSTKVIKLPDLGCFSDLFILGNRIYSVFKPRTHSGQKTFDNGMVEYDLKTGKHKLVFYSRRKPVETVLDARSYRIETVRILSEKYILVLTEEEEKFEFYIIDTETGAITNLREMVPGFMKDYLKYICDCFGGQYIIFKYVEPSFVSILYIHGVRFRPLKKYFRLEGVSRYIIHKQYKYLNRMREFNAYFMLIHNKDIPFLLIDGTQKKSPLREKVNKTRIYGLDGDKKLAMVTVPISSSSVNCIINTKNGAFEIHRNSNKGILFYSKDMLRKIFESQVSTTPTVSVKDKK